MYRQKGVGEGYTGAGQVQRQVHGGVESGRWVQKCLSTTTNPCPARQAVVWGGKRCAVAGEQGVYVQKGCREPEVGGRNETKRERGGGVVEIKMCVGSSGGVCVCVEGGVVEKRCAWCGGRKGRSGY